MSDARKITFRVRLETVEAIDELVRAGVAPSKNALIDLLVKQAFRRYRLEKREAELAEQYRDAFSDPEYAAEQRGMDWFGRDAMVSHRDPGAAVG